MQKIRFLIFTALFGLLSSCEKIYDHIPKGNGGKHGCKIRKVVSADYETLYYYGQKGLLDSIIIVPEQPFPQLSYSYLKYDQNKRLIEYSQFIERNSFAIDLHHYKYSGNKVLQDTNYSNALGPVTIVEDLEYDNQSRIIGITGKLWENASPSQTNPLSPATYVYNNKGNIVKEMAYGGSWEYTDYDNETHPWNTDPVLQFIHRDYSRNNRLSGPLTYNEVGLPLLFSGVDGHQGFAIEYSCK